MARCMPSGVTPYDPADDNSGDNSTPEDTYANWQPESGISWDGGSCRNLYDQACGENCTSCKWSWPLGDPDTWASSDALCRCEAKHTFIWGSECGSLTDGLCGERCTECREANLFSDASGVQPTCRCKSW